jgi:hypothetical protein
MDEHIGEYIVRGEGCVPQVHPALQAGRQAGRQARNLHHLVKCLLLDPARIGFVLFKQYHLIKILAGHVCAEKASDARTKHDCAQGPGWWCVEGPSILLHMLRCLGCNKHCLRLNVDAGAAVLG